MPKTGIPGSYGNSIVSVLKNLHAVLHSDRSNLQSHPQCRRVSFSSDPPQCLLSTDFSMMAILTRGFPDSSVGKESIGNAGDPDSWGRKSRRRRDRLPTPGFLGFPCGSAGRESACNAGDLGSIPGLGRSPGEGKGHPLQDSGLENSLDCIVHGVA